MSQLNDSHPKSIVAELKHRQIRQLIQVFDFGEFVGTQIQLFQFDQFIQVFNLCDSIKAEIQDSERCNQNDYRVLFSCHYAP